ncbi:uncharacterized protein LOC124273457 [Haliotis rubra]|uniref:uncharacterized protein LOC124273457 n=1 Tax=Haliotis rubra TaxID=36100 RepID=UPI001EE51B63|nr:uncharacterized protein LOC124273457 [Haliotis rubra]
MMSLYKNCSTATRCVYHAPRRLPGRAFSVVKYHCIDNGDSLNISGGSAEGLGQVSLIHRDKVLHSSTIQNNTYVCSFKSNLNTESISVYVLDARLGQGTPGQCLSQLSVLHESYISTSNCSTEFQPFERLDVALESLLHIYSKDIPRLSSGLIWLLVNASDPFDVKCEPVASTGGITTESTNDRSPASTPSTKPRDITTRPYKDEIPMPTSSRFPPGVFMGGVAAGAVIVILVNLAVYVLVIRRRYDLTPKKQGDRPASVEHPTYSGLSAGGDVNNYTSIELTSSSQEDTAHGSAATPDYQNM